MILTENIEQDNLKLIRLDNNQFVIVDFNARIHKDEYVYHPHVAKEFTNVKKIKGKTIYEKCYHVVQGVYKHKPTTNPFYNMENKIIFATSELNLEGVNVISAVYTSAKVEAAKKASEYAVKTGSIENGIHFNEGYKQAQQELYTKEQVEEAIKLAQTVDYEVDAYTILRDFKMRSNDNIFNKLKQVKVEVNLTDNTAKFI